MTLRRIAYVLKVFPKISETFIISELAELRRRGVELQILSLLPPRDEPRHDLVSSAGLDQLTCYEPKDFLQLLNAFKPDLLHAHFATEATAAAIELSSELNLPFTFTAHGYDIHRKAPPDLGARAAVARAVVTVSQSNRDYLARTFGVPPAHLRVIPCGVDTDRFRPAEGCADPTAAPLIVCVARHVAVKNLGLLLQGCKVLLDRGVTFQCVLVGDGPCQPELEAQRQALGLQQHVRLAGAAEQADVLRWWQRAALGVLTSKNEGMPVSLMEAAACAVPAVATSVGGLPELIANGVTGVLVPPGDASALADALERLLTDPALRTRLGQAARQRAETDFSVRRQVDQLLALWSEVLAGARTSGIFVSDPFRAIADPNLPTLTLALDADSAKEELKRRPPRIAGENGKLRVKAIRVIRHKPGKRCVVEYDVRVQSPEANGQSLTLIGKVRARRFGKEGCRLLEQIWNSGFQSDCSDGISVPEPLGFVPRFQMWFQRKVQGQTATRLLGGPDGVQLARRVAEAVHKLHQAGVPTESKHGMADELRILHQCLAKVAIAEPAWAGRLQRVLTACDRLGTSLPEPKACGIHRDFYPAQVVVDPAGQAGGAPLPPPGRIWLLDFDLYCLGDPALDIGNFVGHMIEQSLRELGDGLAMASQQEALVERFLALSGQNRRAAVEVYTTLTVVRHIYLSHQFPDRQPFTDALISLCEQRLGLVG